jgi:pimeloyl-ACP methyl ester carboxylesterase/DNA-binding CsgD family transcriptional regulator
MEHEVRYCTTSDGVRIAYSVEGEGPPLLFCQFVYSFSVSHIVPTLDKALRQIGRGRRLIRYDVRGTGLSQREVNDLSPEADMRDMEAVVRAAGLTRFTILTAGNGGPRGIEYTALHPEEVAGLVLYGAFARVRDVYADGVLQGMAQLARANWELASHALGAVGIRRRDAQEGLRWAEMTRASITGETMARIIEQHADQDVTPLLNDIKCPTLVCHSVDNGHVPFALGQRMAALIPNARLVPLQGEDGGVFTDPEAAVDVIEEFLPAPLRATTESFRTSRNTPAALLTPRETEVLRLIAAGQTSKEISRNLSLSIRTVGRHITNIYNKVGARSRADATAYAVRHRIATE